MSLLYLVTKVTAEIDGDKMNTVNYLLCYSFPCFYNTEPQLTYLSSSSFLSSLSTTLSWHPFHHTLIILILILIFIFIFIFTIPSLLHNN